MNHARRLTAVAAMCAAAYATPAVALADGGSARITIGGKSTTGFAAIVCQPTPTGMAFHAIGPNGSVDGQFTDPPNSRLVSLSTTVSTPATAYSPSADYSSVTHNGKSHRIEGTAQGVPISVQITCPPA